MDIYNDAPATLGSDDVTDQKHVLEMEKLAMSLPYSIPEAAPQDLLYTFAIHNPLEVFEEGGVVDWESVWQDSINPMLHQLFWEVSDDDLAGHIRRGEFGVCHNPFPYMGIFYFPIFSFLFVYSLSIPSTHLKSLSKVTLPVLSYITTLHVIIMTHDSDSYRMHSIPSPS